MTISRRAFLSGSAAFTAIPMLGRPALAAPLPREADIVVIGAGAVVTKNITEPGTYAGNPIKKI